MEPVHFRVEYIKDIQLGRGTFGEVIRVSNAQSGVNFAMKIAKEKPGARYYSSPKEVLIKEIAIHKTLIHPNIIRYIDAFPASDNGKTIIEEESGSNIVMVLELCSESLIDLVIKDNPSNSVIKKYVTDVVHGMIYLKERKIIHRDLTSNNIMICGNIAKIADFGAAIREGEKGEPLHKHYINSPEIITSGEYSYASEVWALGVTIYHLILGEFPFGAGSKFNEYRAANGIYEIPKFAASWPNTISLLKEMLDVDPNKRIKIEYVLAHKFFPQKAGNDDAEVKFRQAWDEFGGNDRTSFYMFLANKNPNDPPMSEIKFNELFDKLYLRKSNEK